MFILINEGEKTLRDVKGNRGSLALSAAEADCSKSVLGMYASCQVRI